MMRNVQLHRYHVCIKIDRTPLTARNCPLTRTMASSPPPVEDQARLLEDALAVVRQQAQLMRRCLETPGKLMDALKCRYVKTYEQALDTNAREC
jgi:hypothetical protein